ncbi:MAG TPA: DUF4317 domain-containing protein [Candidatus Limivivens merdigallinarum]|uniref:DUF4317 domain-containing protein n=1 Tax=Candidatus Limivivens merdigallinarum TaxID=2840859 RepID=A0A9D1D1U6_9FIRM|nr:DUF4317 domain-containing protein [Candidatus Limivivens merdigallinarum]
MNKKEISEIKRQFTGERCAITRITGCYVDGNKEKKLIFKEAFLSLPEEEIFKYFELFKKTLSGTLGKNLLNMEFPLSQELEGGTQDFLLKLKETKLKNDAMLELFYDRVIASYDYGENYLILLIHGAYDIPGRASDNLEMEDASTDVYDYLLCSICPVKLSKAGLCYDAEHNAITDRIRDWIVEMPSLGFLFPAFNDRNTDLHSLLYYTRNPEQLDVHLMDEVLGCTIPLTAKDQKETFNAIVEETFGSDCDFETVRSLHEHLTEMVEEKKEDPAPLALDKTEVKKLLSQCGADTEKLTEFEEKFDGSVGEKNAFLASNVTNLRKFEVKTPDVVIQVNPERADLVETREIDGRTYLMIEVNDSVEVNGISVHPLKRSRD